MIEITYLDVFKQENTIRFETYEEFERSQQACLITIPDYYQVTKLSYKGHVLDYQGTYGSLFFYMLEKDLTKYE